MERDLWQSQMGDLAAYHVLKMPRVLQALMYLLGISREDICEPGTNILAWKRA